MKCTISTLDQESMDMKPVGTIQVLNGKCVASDGAKPFLQPELTADDGSIVTPADGEKYLAALPPEYSHSSYINADIA